MENETEIDGRRFQMGFNIGYQDADKPEVRKGMNELKASDGSFMQGWKAGVKQRKIDDLNKSLSELENLNKLKP